MGLVPDRQGRERNASAPLRRRRRHRTGVRHDIIRRLLLLMAAAVAVSVVEVVDYSRRRIPSTKNTERPKVSRYVLYYYFTHAQQYRLRIELYSATATLLLWNHLSFD
jgi:hypothetical protein